MKGRRNYKSKKESDPLLMNDSQYSGGDDEAPIMGEEGGEVAPKAPEKTDSEAARAAKER